MAAIGLVGTGAKDRGRRRRTSQVEFASAVRARRARIHNLVTDLVLGPADITRFFDDFYTELLDAHATAWGQGRGRAGDLSQDLNDFLRGRQFADAETEWLERFEQQLREGWGQDENGNWLPDKIKNRTDLYTLKVRGTANKAFVETSDPDTEFDWVLGGAERHCNQCPEIAQLSPFTIDTLFTTPGAGATPCGGRCKCHLERDDGITGFKPVSLVA